MKSMLLTLLLLYELINDMKTYCGKSIFVVMMGVNGKIKTMRTGLE